MFQRPSLSLSLLLYRQASASFRVPAKIAAAPAARPRPGLRERRNLDRGSAPAQLGEPEPRTRDRAEAGSAGSSSGGGGVRDHTRRRGRSCARAGARVWGGFRLRWASLGVPVRSRREVGTCREPGGEVSPASGSVLTLGARWPRVRWLAFLKACARDRPLAPLPSSPATRLTSAPPPPVPSAHPGLLPRPSPPRPWCGRAGPPRRDRGARTARPCPSAPCSEGEGSSAAEGLACGNGPPAQFAPCIPPRSSVQQGGGMGAGCWRYGERPWVSQHQSA